MAIKVNKSQKHGRSVTGDLVDLAHVQDTQFKLTVLKYLIDLT